MVNGMQVDFISLGWLMLGLIMVVGLLMMASAFITGWLVFRTKREQHERLMVGKAPERKTTGPIHRDPIAMDRADIVEKDDPIADIIQKQNSKFAEAFAKENMRGKK